MNQERMIRILLVFRFCIDDVMTERLGKLDRTRRCDVVTVVLGIGDKRLYARATLELCSNSFQVNLSPIYRNCAKWIAIDSGSVQSFLQHYEILPSKHNVPYLPVLIGKSAHGYGLSTYEKRKTTKYNFNFPLSLTHSPLSTMGNNAIFHRCLSHMKELPVTRPSNFSSLCPFRKASGVNYMSLRSTSCKSYSLFALTEIRRIY